MADEPSGSWRLRDDTIYLNHGSFGPPPEAVRAERLAWLGRLDRQPMDFFVRQLAPAWDEARRRLAEFVGAAAENLVFVPNATAAMNVVAASFPLSSGDEVLLTDHEYGAVRRIWERACARSKAKIATAALPLPIESVEQVIDALFSAATPRTRLLVVSHITSPTAVILPIEDIRREAERREIAVCVDGPHAVAQIELRLDALDCDYYTASCHKWLSAPFGSGFLYVHPRRQTHVEPPILSWGVPPPRRPAAWWEEFFWCGTGDPTPYLSVPAAIEFLKNVGCEAFRAQTHELARYARRRLSELTGLAPPAPDCRQWCGSMTLAPLPPGGRQSLQTALWEKHGIEVPIIEWSGRRFIRVSCHLYNDTSHIDRLVEALAELLRSE
ncbi:MAG: aminotransferase class V-fold PLP-dependent enzyme [Planctomycetes bacterium]|nr:aminotransferase class V-fold PLP-dependent enzyme [Planctomycetota bacterium]